MPRPSNVKTLPKEVKEWLDQTLVENNFSGYQQLEEALRERGYQISKSAIHRYGQNFEKRLQDLKLATEQARAIVAASPDDEGAINEALMRLVQEQIFTVLKDFKHDPDKPLNLASLAKAVAELGRASVTQKKWAADVKKKAQEAANVVALAAKKGGLSDETVDQIKRQILGIAA